MTALVNVTKRFGPKVILDNVSFAFPTTGATGLLGRNGAGKSTLMRLITGTALPDRGRVLRQGRVSWPVGLTSAFHRDLSGADNVRVIAHLYQADAQQVLRRAEALAQLGRALFQPVKSYSSGMFARLGFALSMAIPFDLYLLDEVTAVGDQTFKQLCKEALAQRIETAPAIVVSHSMPLLRDMCQSGVVLDGGKLHHYAHIDGAIGHYNRLMAASA